jgi:hypothetical protein
MAINAKLERVAVRVESVDAVVADLERIFGHEYVVTDAEEVGLRAGISETGLELVEPAVEEPRPMRYWRGPLCALCFAVDDIDAAIARMREAGYEPVHEIELAGGLREAYYGAAFHDLPMLLYSRTPDGFVAGTQGDGTEASVRESVWHD